MTLTAVREIVTAITSLVLSATTPNADFLDFNYREPILGRNAKTYLEDTIGVNTPYKIRIFFDKFIKYDPLNDFHDGHPCRDYMQSPLETYLVGKGDCDDFANFACKRLRSNGYNAQVMGVQGNGFGHAFCVYIDNEFRIISNDMPDKRFKSLREIADYYKNDWNKFQLLEQDILSQDGSKVIFEMNRDGKTKGKTDFPMVIE